MSHRLGGRGGGEEGREGRGGKGRGGDSREVEGRARGGEGREGRRKEEVGWKKRGGRIGDYVGMVTSMYSRHTRAVNTPTHRVQ